jgi:hypothetical protein
MFLISELVIFPGFKHHARKKHIHYRIYYFIYRFFPLQTLQNIHLIDFGHFLSHRLIIRK